MIAYRTTNCTQFWKKYIYCNIGQVNRIEQKNNSYWYCIFTIPCGNAANVLIVSIDELATSSLLQPKKKKKRIKWTTSRLIPQQTNRWNAWIQNLSKLGKT